MSGIEDEIREKDVMISLTSKMVMEIYMALVMTVLVTVMEMKCQEVHYKHNYALIKWKLSLHALQGPIKISRGEVAQTIYDWILVKTVAFDFKITSRSRGRRSIAVLSDIGGYRCCSIGNAMFSIYLGIKLFFQKIDFAKENSFLEKTFLTNVLFKTKEFDLSPEQTNFINIWTNGEKTEIAYRFMV